MQQPPKLQKPVRIGGLRKDRPICEECNARPGEAHAPFCSRHKDTGTHRPAPRGDDGPPREER